MSTLTIDITDAAAVSTALAMLSAITAVKLPAPDAAPPPPPAPAAVESAGSTPTPESPPTAETNSEDGTDRDGFPWDERIHSSNHKKLAKTGTWQLKRNVTDELVAQVRAECQGAATPPPPPASMFDAKEWDFVTLMKEADDAGFDSAAMDAACVAATNGLITSVMFLATANAETLGNVAMELGL